MEWFLVISLIGSDELLVKHMESKQECVKVQEEFSKKVQKKLKDIRDVTCEQGEMFESYNAGVKDEVL